MNMLRAHARCGRAMSFAAMPLGAGIAGGVPSKPQCDAKSCGAKKVANATRMIAERRQAGHCGRGASSFDGTSAMSAHMSPMALSGAAISIARAENPRPGSSPGGDR